MIRLLSFKYSTSSSSHNFNFFFENIFILLFFKFFHIVQRKRYGNFLQLRILRIICIISKNILDYLLLRKLSEIYGSDYFL